MDIGVPRIAKPFESWTSVTGRAKAGGSEHAALVVLKTRRKSKNDLSGIVTDAYRRCCTSRGD